MVRDNSYGAYAFPKEYEIADKISKGVKNYREIEIVHSNGTDDVYKSPVLGSMIIVNKGDKNFDIVEISGNNERSKKELEKITGEEFHKINLKEFLRR